MSSPSNDQEQSSEFQSFTKAERIQQLNDIDKSITQLLQSAGLALKTLSASQSDSAQSSSNRREAFEHASNSYLKTLQTVDVGLRRQIYGLEEANIIPAEKAKKGKDGQDGSTMGGLKTAAAAEPSSGDSGMGKLDIGWLNSRSGRVGRDMEAELWEKAKGFLEDLEKGKGDGAAHEEKDVDMT
ncbi:hypothetical protein EG329_001364 [Mollisiaceae sp. DMI_Dod_QoI]|nr:hypothetical protein EG329_001364 [Helotiales sp. DMI_Dod_QoI]